MHRLNSVAAAVATLTLISLQAQASDVPYSTGVDTDYPKRVFFGDLHLHSNIPHAQRATGFPRAPPPKTLSDHPNPNPTLIFLPKISWGECAPRRGAKPLPPIPGIPVFCNNAKPF